MSVATGGSFFGWRFHGDSTAFPRVIPRLSAPVRAAASSLGSEVDAYLRKMTEDSIEGFVDNHRDDSGPGSVASLASHSRRDSGTDFRPLIGSTASSIEDVSRTVRLTAVALLGRFIVLVLV